MTNQSVNINICNATIKDLSELTGIPGSTWTMILQGYRRPSARTVLQAADRLGIEPEVVISQIKKRRALEIELKHIA